MYGGVRVCVCVCMGVCVSVCVALFQCVLMLLTLPWMKPIIAVHMQCEIHVSVSALQEM